MTVSQHISAVAIITGGSRGFGRAVAAALLERGWTVVTDARRTDDLAATAAELDSARLIPVPGDVTQPAHRTELVVAALDAGPLRLLVNNASLLGPSPQPRLVDYLTADLRAVYDTNVFAPLALIQAAVPVLPGDDEDALAARVLQAEHRIYPQAVQWFLEGRVEFAAGDVVRIRGSGVSSDSLISPRNLQ